MMEARMSRLGGNLIHYLLPDGLDGSILFLVRQSLILQSHDQVSVLDGRDRIASIDIKADEAGLTDCAARLGVPLSFYSAQELAAVPGTFSASEFVREAVGVDNVCERAAVCAGGSLIIPKTAADGVTVAAAELDWRVAF